MPVFGYKRTFREVRQRVRFTPESGHSEAQERLGLKKRTLNVCFAPDSGRKWLSRGMPAFDPKRTFAVLGVFGLSHERLRRCYGLAPAHCIPGAGAVSLMRADL